MRFPILLSLVALVLIGFGCAARPPASEIAPSSEASAPGSRD